MFDIYVRGYTLPKLTGAIILLIASIFAGFKLIQSLMEGSLFYIVVSGINVLFFVYAFVKLELLKVLLQCKNGMTKYDKVWQLEQKLVENKQPQIIDQSPNLDLYSQKSESERSERKEDFQELLQRYIQENKKNKNQTNQEQSEKSNIVRGSQQDQANRYNKSNLKPTQRKTNFTRQAIQKGKSILIKIFKIEKDAQQKNLQIIKQKIQQFLNVAILDKGQEPPAGFQHGSKNTGLNAGSFSLFPLDQGNTKGVSFDEIICHYRQGNLWKCGYSINSYARIQSNKQCVRQIEEALNQRDSLDKAINFGALINSHQQRIQRIKSLQKLCYFYGSFSNSKLSNTIEDREMKLVKRLQIYYLSNHLNQMVRSFDYRLQISLKNEFVKPIQQYQLLIQWITESRQTLYYNQIALIKYNKLQYLKQVCPKDKQNTIHLFLSYLQLIKKMYGNDALKINKDLKSYYLQIIKTDK